MLTAHEIKLRFGASIGTSSVVSPYFPGQSAQLNERARELRGELRIPRGGSAFAPITALSDASPPREAPPPTAAQIGSEK